LHVLGEVDLRDPQGAEARQVLAQPKRLAVLTYLALAAPRGFHRRDSVIALFWPELDTAGARNALRQALHFLRRALGADAIAARGAEEVGVEASRVWCDAVAFEAALDAGELERALELYRGDLLPGFFVSGVPAFEEWLEGERRRLRERAVGAAWKATAREEAAGHGAGAIRAARHAVVLAPDDERGLRRLLELHLRLGDRAGALRAYDEFAARMEREFGVTPSPETVALLAGARAPARRPPLEPLPAPLVEPAAHRDPSPAPAPSPPRRRLLRPRLAAAAIVVVTLAAAGAVASRRRPAAPPVSDAVAVLPVHVRGRADVGYLRDGMVELLSAKLDGAGGLRSVDPRAVLAATARGDTAAAVDPARGGAVARRLGARLYVLGGVVEIAGRLQVSAALFDRDAGAEPLARAAVESDAAQALAAVDRVAALLLASRAGGDTAVAQAAAGATTSLPAFRAYLEGERAFRAGRFAAALEAFQRATALDTGYALAYYRAAVAADWVGLGDTSLTAIAAARARGASLSPVARQMVAGFEAYLIQDPATAEQAFHELTAAHPDNVEAAYMLGETRFHYNTDRGRAFTDARPQLERVLALEPANPPALLHLARIAAAEGRPDEVDDLTRRFLALQPDADRVVEARALRAIATGDSAAQDAVLADLARVSDVALDQAARAVAVFAGDPVAAAAVAAHFARPERSPGYQALGRALGARFEASRGRWRRAAAELDSLRGLGVHWATIDRALVLAAPVAIVPAAELRALAADATRPGSVHIPELAPYVQGIAAARLGDWGALLRAATALERAADTARIWGETLRGIARSLRAQSEWLRGRPRAALEQLDRFGFDTRSLAYRNHAGFGALERYLRADILRALGRDEDALQWYASFPHPNARDLQYLPHALLRRAEIEERLGRRDDARAHYARVVHLWKDCDPEIVPLRAEAERALARLTPPR
jgi:serine/threonine-protein kinase